ncbi:MAG: hypothetical protein J5786_04450, partial [Clostridiales bacterium]|nr:hypothetical protein [Clostridiales bacterium]
MRKHLARIFFIIAAFSIFFAVSVNAEEVESEYTKGITILDEIPSSITYGDTAPVPKIKINGVTFEPGSYTLWYTFDAPDKSAIGYPDYMTPLKSGTCYVGINLAGNTDLCIYLAQLNGESTFAAPAIYRIASFEVNKADMSKCTADPIADVVYDPDDTPLKGISPSVNLYFKGRQLTWQDFDKEYKNNKQAGTATVICTPKDYKPFKGQKTLTFKILPFQLDSQSSISEIADQTYTGNAITPSSFTVYPRKWSTSSDNYTVTYSNNVNVGTATVTVKGKNSLSGSISTTFQITPENISKTTVTISDQVYSGAALKPTPVLTFNGKTLTAGKDYKITGYSDNVNAKTYAYAKISIEGLGNFAGSSVTRSFKILPADISKATFTYTPVVYNRSSYKWEGFTVKYKSVTLKEGTDYTVSRLSADGLTVQWKVTGKGNFQGETTVTQTLLPLDLNDFVAEAYISGSYTYTGSSIKPASVSFRTSEGNNPRLESNVDYKLSYGTNINAGQGTVTVAGIGKYTGTLTVNFTINQASICNADIADIGEQAYTGLPIKPEISATFKGKTLVKDKDYTLTYSKNTAAGTATVRIDGIGNFYSYQTKTFK